MRIGRIQTVDGARFAVKAGDQTWVPLSDLGLAAETTSEVMGLERELAARAAEAGGGDPEPELLCPIVKPGKMLAVGLNYMSHIEEQVAAQPEYPLIFAKYPSSLSDPSGDIVVDGGITQEADYEAELAVLIGQGGTYIAEDSALGAVFGYTVANDVSARDLQRRDSQFSRSKSFDTFCPAGPWITTADHVPDPNALGIRSWVNGEPRQDASTKDMIFSVPFLISYLSQGITLEPGDVILTGTPEGVGFAMDPPHYLAAGDVVECEVEGLGRLANRVVNPT
jgi:2-keto-4-pentenoate hydratase/2-oxohepta-3-ene-1,7-dioic acid hydratase in catechol pathway